MNKDKELSMNTPDYLTDPEQAVLLKIAREAISRSPCSPDRQSHH